jgi:hypothetical protein
MEKSVGNSCRYRVTVKSLKRLARAARIEVNGSTPRLHLRTCDSLLIKSAAIAFLPNR